MHGLLGRTFAGVLAIVCLGSSTTAAQPQDNKFVTVIECSKTGEVGIDKSNSKIVDAVFAYENDAPIGTYSERRVAILTFDGNRVIDNLVFDRVMFNQAPIYWNGANRIVEYRAVSSKEKDGLRQSLSAGLVMINRNSDESFAWFVLISGESKMDYTCSFKRGLDEGEPKKLKYLKMAGLK